MHGWRNGQIVPDSGWQRLSSRLNRNNVAIIKNEWATGVLDKTGQAAQFVRFKDGTSGMSITTMISNICQIVEDFGKSCGLMDFEMERIVRSRTDGKDEWVVQLQCNNIDPLIEDDDRCAIVVVDA